MHWGILWMVGQWLNDFRLVIILVTNWNSLALRKYLLKQLISREIGDDEDETRDEERSASSPTFLHSTLARGVELN